MTVLREVFFLVGKTKKREKFPRGPNILSALVNIFEFPYLINLLTKLSYININNLRSHPKILTRRYYMLAWFLKLKTYKMVHSFSGLKGFHIQCFKYHQQNQYVMIIDHPKNVNISSGFAKSYKNFQKARSENKGSHFAFYEKVNRLSEWEVLPCLKLRTISIPKEFWNFITWWWTDSWVTSKGQSIFMVKHMEQEAKMLWWISF